MTTSIHVRTCCCWLHMFHYISDAPLKEFILSLNAKMDPGKAFLIRDLDDTHIFVHTDYVDYIKHEIDKFKRTNTYETVIM